MADGEVRIHVDVKEEKKEEQLLYQDVAPVVLGFNQSAIPRKWCLSLTCALWLDHASILVILINCVFLGMYEPHDNVTSLQVLDHFSMAFFLVEMAIKVLALGLYGYEGSYLSNNWNKWDFLLYSGEMLDYFLALCGVHLHFRFTLRLMRLISRVSSMQDLVVTLLDILPMLSNVFMLYIFFLVVSGIVGIQLWEGELRNRCFLGADIPNVSLSPYFVPVDSKRGAFICSRNNWGMRHCQDVPPYVQDGKTCSAAQSHGLAANACVNWNMYYNVCRPGDHNPHKGIISFDHIGLASIAMFQTVTLEGWTDIMFLVMDAHSFGSVIVFILVTIMGYFVLMNVCAVVIATQFSKSMTRQARERPANPIGQLCISFYLWLQTTTCRCIRSNRVHPKGSRGGRGVVLGEAIRPVVRGIKRMIESKMFEWLIMFIVFFSVLTLAVEHHEQPQQVTDMLRISNLVFTGIFSMELCLKLLALRWGYFKDGQHILDFILVVISLWDISGKTDGKWSMLRILRLLRFGRLLRFFPNLKRQLLVLLNTMKEGRRLCQLLIYVIIIFSVVGRTLFGGKFKFQTQDGQTINSRMNFDSLHWSMVTVFQVLTEEDWNLVLYDAVAATFPWAFLYFVLIIVVGKHVLLNIMVGIVVKGFQTERGPDEDGSSSPPGQTFESAHEPDGSSMSGGKSPRVTNPTAPQTTDNNTSLSWIHRVLGWCREHKDWSLFMFSPQNRFRVWCQRLVSHRMFDYVILFFILLSCVTLAMERPSIDPAGMERWILKTSRYVFSAIFLVEMIFKVVALGLLYGKESYCRSIWNAVDGTLVILSLVSIIVPLASRSKTKSQLGLLKVFRLLRALRPLRLIKRAPKLRLAVEALIASFKPLGNITLISCTFFFFYGVLGVQLFKGMFYHCVGEDITNITNKSDCLSAGYHWKRKTYNFDNLPQALLTLFVMYSKDGWVTVMFDGLDAVGVDQQPVRNHDKWKVLFFITFMVMSFFLFDMFVGVMVDTFHECQQKQKRQDEAEAGGQPLEDKPREAEEEPYYADYSPLRRYIHSICKGNALDYASSTIVTINILVMALQHYGQTPWVEMLVEGSFCVFTIILVIEILLKLTAFGIRRCTASFWNLLDIAVALISIVSIFLESMNMTALPFNPSILRVCRALRLIQVLKAKKIEILLKTIIKTLSQVGNICVLFLFVFFIYAVLGVELFGKLECSKENPCLGLHGHFNFRNFGMALLTLYQVCTGDNWSGIMKDALRECHPGDTRCLSYLSWASPIFFITFVMMAQFVLVNLVVGAIMQALEDSCKEAKQHQNEPPPPQSLRRTASSTVSPSPEFQEDSQQQIEPPSESQDRTVCRKMSPPPSLPSELFSQEL